MSDKIVTLKRYNGSTYDNLFPETTIEQVDNLQTALDSKQDKLTAGDNISIDTDNKISATYTASDGIAITTGNIAHTNAVTALTTGALGEVTYDAQGHITGFTAKPVVDNVSSTSVSNPLSANQGKLLNDRIDNLSQIGRYLALWDCATGKPTTNPTTMPYTYKAGDYYRVSNIVTASHLGKYKHSVYITGTTRGSDPSTIATIIIYNDSSTNLVTDYDDWSNLASWLYNNDYVDGNPYTNITGFIWTSIGSSAGDPIDCWALNEHDICIHGKESSMGSDIYCNMIYPDFTPSYPGLSDTITLEVNKRPEGSSYNDVASTTQETEDVQIGDVYFYDGTSWSLQINHIGGLVTDVKVDSTSIVSSGTATLVSGQHTLPSQTSQSGKYLTTNGSVASWGTIDMSSKEDTSNKVTSETGISSSSTDTQYPSAKCVYDIIGNVETLLSQI